MVLSGADPRHTFETLCDPADLPVEFLRAVRNIRSDGTSIKINLALDRLPVAAAVPGTGPQPYHHGVLELGPTLDVLDLQQAEARAGVPATGAHIEMCFPTVHDPSLAPEGKHVATIDINSQPYTLAEGDWDSHQGRDRRSRADRARRLLPGAVLRRSSIDRSSRPWISSGCSASPAAMRCTARWLRTSCS